MAGTVKGGKRAAKTIKKLHGPDFYKTIGSKGGKNGTTGGFASFIDCYCASIVGKHHNAQCAGALGGSISRRVKKV